MSLITPKRIALIELSDNGYDYSFVKNYCIRMSDIAYTDWGKKFWTNVWTEVIELEGRFK